MFICECSWFSLSLLYWYKSTDTDTSSARVTANTCSATSRFSKRLCRMYASGVCLRAPSTTYQVGNVSICTFVLVKQVNPSGVCLRAPSTIYQVGNVSICTFVLVKKVNVGCTVRERRVPACLFSYSNAPARRVQLCANAKGDGGRDSRSHAKRRAGTSY
jgi:hypothetical protein